MIIFDQASKIFEKGKPQSLKRSVIEKLKGTQERKEFLAVESLSFSVMPGESVALIGKNGSGKSTALKLLSGVIRPDAGSVWTKGRVGGLLEVGAGFHPELTGRENIYLNAAILGMSKKETDMKFDAIVEFSEIGEFIDTEVKKYSSGMYARLGFSVAIHTELDVLIIDEALSVGDAEFKKKCAEKLKMMRKNNTTMLIVSHSESQILDLCSRAILMVNGKIKFNGTPKEAFKKMKSMKYEA